MKRKLLTKIVIVNITFYILHFTSFAQDIHFSQFYQTPLLLNPALTGNFNGDQRVIVNHKDQWKTMSSSSSSAYRTSFLSFDMGVMKKKWKSAYIGTGLTVYSDKAGDTQLGTTQANLSASAIVYVASNHILSLGLQGGFAQRSINNSKMQWGNQFNSNTGGFDPSLPGEANKIEPFTFGDFSTGLSWSYGSEASSLFANNEFKANAGVALFHVNKPAQKFNTYEQVDKMYSKLVAHAGMHIGIGKTNFAVQPSMFYMQQGPQKEINFGAFVRYQLRAESKYTGAFKETAVSIGGYSRAKDAVIPSILVEYSSFALGFSYDMNVLSDLKTVSNKKGGFEVSLKYVNPNPFRGGTTQSVRFL